MITSVTTTKCVHQTNVKMVLAHHSLALLQIFACMRTAYLFFNKVVLMETPRTNISTIKIAFQGMLIIQHPSLFWVGTETADQIHDEMCHEGSNKIYAAEGSDFCLPADFDGANYITGELCLMPTKQHWLVKKTTQSFHAKPSRLFYSHKGSV